jgi:ubiquinol-cytochrome c reductase cytochrome c subunit
VRFLSARLSAKRRSPLAGVVVLLMGLLFTGGAYAVLSPAVATDDLANDQALVDQGRELFLVGCSSCHGRNAEGVTTKDGSQYGVTEKHMYEAMVTGPQQMPVFSDDVLKPEEKRDIINYVKSLEENPGYGGFSMGALGPVSEGMFAWVVGIGALVGFAVWIAAHTAKSEKGKKA